MRSTGSHRKAAATLAAVVLFGAGAIRAETIHFEGTTETAGLTLQTQGVAGVEIRYEMGSFSMEPLVVNGTAAQKILLPGSFLPNDAGAPDLPGLSDAVAIPEGASVTFEVVGVQTRVFRNVDVSPAPVIPREDDDAPLTYARDAAIYSRDAFYPEDVVQVSEPFQLRGVDAVRVGVRPFRYNPVRRELEVHAELEVRLRFHGGTGTFGEERLRSRYWDPILRNHLMNFASLPAVDYDVPRADGHGYEYMIITPDDPAFRAWGDTLKAWRKLQGIRAETFTTTDVGGTSSAAIEAFINEAYENWDPAPVAFLLLGDDPGSGDRDTGIISPVWSGEGGSCVSDNIYADWDGDDLPELVGARITARNEDELERMITKMLDYERHPYTDPGFYDHPVIAGGWQDDRWFILCTETIYGHQSHILGKSPVREYAIYSGDPGTLWSGNPNTEMVVDYFGPNGLGYIPATPEHLTDWGGDATRVNNDLNSGAYMVMHRDHGFEDGWGEPYYRIGDLDGLHNGMCPFVFSINCKTGRYDWEGECFGEALHRMGHGALGLVAATGTSYSFVNDTFVWGVMDELWPDFLPGNPPRYPGAGDLRPAFGAASGKHFLIGSEWPSNPQHKAITCHLFHTHGDAFVRMYTEVPEELVVTHAGACSVDVSRFPVQATEGSIISLTVDGEIVGVAEATGAMQDVQIIPPEEPGSLRITVTAPNYVRHDETVPIVPPEGPYMVVDEVVVDDDTEEESSGNGDGDGDAGEQIELLVGLRNVGSEAATNVRATLMTEDEHCDIGDDVEAYGDIDPGVTVFCLEDFDVTILPGCPDGHSILFVLVAESDSLLTWEKTFTLEVEAPIMALESCFFDDHAGGNGNGRAEPGETISLSVAVANEGREDATNLVGQLVIDHPYVTVHQDDGQTALLPEDGIAVLTPPFEVEIGGSFADPGRMCGRLAVSADWQQSAELEICVPVGGFFDDVEAGEGQWTHYVVTDGFVDQWHRSTTRNFTLGGQWSWKSGDLGDREYAGLSDGALESEPLILRDNAFLSFRHWMEAQTSGDPGYCCDGGLVEMSIGGGPWEQIFPVGGYPYLVRESYIPGPFPPETAAYSGEIDWAEAVFEIIGQGGSEVRFRFRFGSNGLQGCEGWYIDDVECGGYDDDPAGAEETIAIGLHPAVDGNRPNPFGPSTSIRYRMPSAGDVWLQVYDPAGRLVRTLVKGHLSAGAHVAAWNGLNDAGAAAPSGVYFLRLETEGRVETRKMLLAR